MTKKILTERENRDQIELGSDLAPKFNEDGLIPCITVNAVDGEILMFAWMNRESLLQTLDSGKATYYSRSRKKVWVKGETSGRTQYVEQILVDCDQDVIQLRVRVEGEGACHRGYRTCFYRAVSDSSTGQLEFIEEEPVFNPEDVYGKNND